MEEFLPLWNAAGESEGKTMSRSAVHSQGLMHPVVHVWVFDPQGRFLIQRRALNRPTNPGLWDVSCAGHMGAGQTPGEAAVRELREEVGLKARPGDLIFKGRTYRELILPGMSDREFQLLFVFNMLEICDEPPFDPEEVAQTRWIDPQEYIRAQEEQDPDYVLQGNDYLEIFRKAIVS